MMKPSVLPELSSDYLLNQDHSDEFHRNGYVLLRGLATPEEIAASQLNPLVFNRQPLL